MAHSALRYLLLAVALGSALYFGAALVRRRSLTSRDRALAAAFAGLVDLQVLLGFGVLALGQYYPALIGHIATMIAAAAAAHFGVIVEWRRQEPRPLPLLAGIALSVLLMVGGVFAIGRGPLEAAAF